MIVEVETFRDMRLSGRKMHNDAAEKLLLEGMYGVLAVRGDGGYPYTVPLNYAYENGCIFFHCAKEGHKLDAIAGDKKVSFCVVGETRAMPERFTTFYRSVIAFGKARLVEDDGEKLVAMRLISAKYSPGLEQEGEETIKRTWGRLNIVKIKVEHLSGKELK